MRLQGKMAIVTGSSRGLGRAIALAFAREGADVLVNYAGREDAAKEVAGAIESLGRRALPCRADVSNAAQVRAMVDAAVAAFGRVDILVNNAGITLVKSPLETTETDWDRVMAVDLKSVFLCSQAVASGMINQGGGRIIKHVLHSRADRQPVRPRLLRSEGRRDRPHQIARPRVRAAQHPRSTRSPGHD